MHKGDVKQWGRLRLKKKITLKIPLTRFTITSIEAETQEKEEIEVYVNH